MASCFPFLRNKSRSYRQLPHLTMEEKGSGSTALVSTIDPGVSRSNTRAMHIETAVDGPETLWIIARSIQQRLGSLSADAEPPNFLDGNGDDATPGSEDRLFSLLRDPAVMSPAKRSSSVSSNSAGGATQELVSVWEALAALSASDEGTLEDDGATASIMFYVPLEPSEEDVVEVAQAQSSVFGPSGYTSGGDRAKIKGWVPSSDRISVEIFWWGYAMYLPEDAVTRIDKMPWRKRAAVILAMLTFLANRVPIVGIPSQCLPTVELLKGLIISANYLARYLGWWWFFVKRHDQGQGVILRATWLLPVAPIPEAWIQSS